MIAVLHSRQLPSDSGRTPPRPKPPLPSFSSLGLSPTESILLNHVSVCARLPMSRCSNLAHGNKKQKLTRTFAALHFYFGLAVLFGWLGMRGAGLHTRKVMTDYLLLHAMHPSCRSWWGKKGQKLKDDRRSPPSLAVKLTEQICSLLGAESNSSSS